MTDFVSRLCCLIVALSIVACDPNEDVDDDLVLSTQPGTLNFNTQGGTLPLVVSMNGKSWVATSSQSWCTVSSTESSQKVTTIQVSTTANDTREKRTAIIEFVMNGQVSVSMAVTQDVAVGVYPIYSIWKARDNTGMPSDALTLASQMSVGWNLGNTLEVPGDETAWGNPKVNQAFINAVRAAGFDAIRIPCAWDSYVENANTLKLKSSWLARVKEVVDFCVSNDMHVILNIHWDGGWLENNPLPEKKQLVNGKQRAYWEQIAMYFRDYDERLLFAGTNEVHASTSPTTENFNVQMSFNQTFVDAVRSTGGRNSYRNLVIQAYNTNIDYAVDHLIVPNDTIDNRLMVEVHYYDPWDFCGLEADASWATAKSLWGQDYEQFGEISNWGQEDYMTAQFQKMKTKFVDQGYPIILGEFGAIRRPSTISGFQQHLDSRAYYLKFLAEQAKNNGAVPFIWDNGSTGALGMGLFNRNTGSISDTQALNAYLEGIALGHYPF